MSIVYKIFSNIKCFKPYHVGSMSYQVHFVNVALLSHIAHFHNTIALPLLVFETLGFIFAVSFLHFKQYDFILIRSYMYLLF